MNKKYIYIHGSRHSGSGALHDYLLCSDETEFIDSFIPWEIISSYKGLNLNKYLHEEVESIDFIKMFVFEFARTLEWIAKSIIISLVRVINKNYKLRTYSISISRVLRYSYKYHLLNIIRLVKSIFKKNKMEYLIESYFKLLDNLISSKKSIILFDALASDLNLIQKLNSNRDSLFVFVYRDIIEQLTQRAILDSKYLSEKNLLSNYNNALLSKQKYSELSRESEKVITVDFDNLISSEDYRDSISKALGINQIYIDDCKFFEPKSSQNNKMLLQKSNEYNIITKIIHSDKPI
jgi:hypothetical protein